MRNDRGFTLIELVIGVFMIVVLIGAGFGVYAMVHFIAKFW